MLETQTFSGGTLVIVFTDGTELRTAIPSAPYVPGAINSTQSGTLIEMASVLDSIQAAINQIKAILGVQ